MEMVRRWFGTAGAAAKTLIWLLWVTFLASVLVTVVYLGIFVMLALT